MKIERNESVTVSSASLPSDAQVMQVPLNGKNITLNELVEKGSSNNPTFWQYSPLSSGNCQAFTSAMLRNNGLLTNEASKFITQNAEALLEGSPEAQKFSETITDIGSRFHILLHGVGRKKRRFIRR